MAAVDTPCSVDDCEKPVDSLSMCSMHATRLRRHGDVHYTTRPMVRGRSVEERFWAKVNKYRNPLGCWEWTAGTWAKRGGYGKFQAGTGRANSRAVYAHRFSYELVHGEINDPSLVVCHSCDNPLCVNPQHLWLGSKGDNMRDMGAKGRRRVYV